jgi:hypothetical protein
MVEQSHKDQIEIRAKQFPQAIRRLRRLEVRATTLAWIFNESPDYIRHVDGRANDASIPISNPSTFDVDDLALQRLSPAERAAQVREFEQVEATVWAIFWNHQSVGLDEGFDTLLAMRPGVANGRHGQALKVRLLLEEKLAWFALPLNRVSIALRHAEAAMSLAVDAFRESAGETSYLLRYTESALVASVCLQKMHRPKDAFAFIKAADEANIAAGQLPGSEHLRQRGAAFTQIGGNDDRAIKAFNRAASRMRRKNEARHPVDLRMSGLRQRALLQPRKDWDDVQQLVLDVADAYGLQSMQYEVAARFAAPVGFKAASPASVLAASRMLSRIEHSPLAQLLAITPELGLSGDRLDGWLRFALYETPRLK